jgi:MFS family permease
VAVFITILIADVFKEQNVISTVFNAANFTYGPLLGLFFFGIFTKRVLNDHWAWLVCLIIPSLLYLMKENQAQIFGTYQFGFELLGINGLLCFLALFLVSKSERTTQIPEMKNANRATQIK